MFRGAREGMDVRGNCTLCLVDSRLSVDEINSALELEPKTLIKKGQMISKALNKKSDTNRWIYEETILDGEQVSQTLTRLLSRLDVGKICYVANYCRDLFISVYLNSDYGQIGFELPTEVIGLLNRVGLRLDVHILSFGIVDDN